MKRIKEDESLRKKRTEEIYMSMKELREKKRREEEELLQVSIYIIYIYIYIK